MAFEVDDGSQVLHVGRQEIELRDAPGGLGARERHAQDVLQSGAQDLVGAVLDLLGDVGIGGPPVGGVVLEAAVRRWVVAGGDHDAVGQAARCGPCCIREWRGSPRGWG